MTDSEASPSADVGGREAGPVWTWQAAAPGEKSESVCETGRTEEGQYVSFKGVGIAAPTLPPKSNAKAEDT